MTPSQRRLGLGQCHTPKPWLPSPDNKTRCRRILYGPKDSPPPYLPLLLCPHQQTMCTWQRHSLLCALVRQQWGLLHPRGWSQPKGAGQGARKRQAPSLPHERGVGQENQSKESTEAHSCDRKLPRRQKPRRQREDHHQLPSPRQTPTHSSKPSSATACLGTLARLVATTGANGSLSWILAQICAARHSFPPRAPQGVYR